MKKRKCLGCGNSFLPSGKGHKWCGGEQTSGTCAYKRKRERKRADYMKWYLKQKENRPEKLCKVCGVQIGKIYRRVRCDSCKEKRIYKPLKLRFRVFTRDKFACQYCGRKPPEVTLETDHVNPSSRGGKSTLENLITACRECNIGKGDMLLCSR